MFLVFFFFDRFFFSADTQQFCFACSHELAANSTETLPFGCIAGGGCGVRLCSRNCYERFLREWASTTHKGPCAMIRQSLSLFVDPSAANNGGNKKKKAVVDKEKLARKAEKNKEAKNAAALQLRGALSASDAGRDCCLQSLLCADLFAEPDMVGTYLGVAAHACNDLKLPRVSLELARKALKLVAPQSLFAAACHSLAGTVLNLQGKHQIALDNFEEALKTLRHLNGDEHGDVASCILSIGNVLVDQNKPTEALVNIELALRIRRGLLAKEAKEGVVAEDTAEIAGCNKSFAVAYSKLGRHDEATAEIERAVATYTRLHPTEPHADLAGCHNSHGVVLAAQNRFDEALAAHKRAFELFAALAKGAETSLDLKLTQKYIDAVTAKLNEKK